MMKVIGTIGYPCSVTHDRLRHYRIQAIRRMKKGRN